MTGLPAATAQRCRDRDLPVLDGPGEACGLAEGETEPAAGRLVRTRAHPGPADLPEAD